MRTFHRAGTPVLAVQLLVFICVFYLSTGAIASQKTGVPDRQNAASGGIPPIPVEKPTRSLAKLRSQLDRNDQLIAMRALHLALSQVPDGGTFVWRKRSRSLKGLIKPTRAFRNAKGQVCRHVIYALSLGRYIKRIEGIACRTQDGSWHL